MQVSVQIAKYQVFTGYGAKTLTFLDFAHLLINTSLTRMTFHPLAATPIGVVFCV